MKQRFDEVLREVEQERQRVDRRPKALRTRRRLPEGPPALMGADYGEGESITLNRAAYG